MADDKHPYRARPKAATHVWLTPPEIIEALGPFDLDPCASPYPRPWDTAHRHITLPNDGLIEAWEGRVWLNPPYGSHTSSWLQKLAHHGNGIALVFARTETEMFARWVWPYAHAALFMAGRPHFHYPDGTRAKGNSGGPMMLIAYGKENMAPLLHGGISGAFVNTMHGGLTVITRGSNASKLSLMECGT